MDFNTVSNYHVVAEIYTLLLKKQNEILNSKGYKKNQKWKEIYTTILDKYSWKMPKYIILPNFRTAS